MNILVPIQKKSDIDALVDAGANEVYCGYVPKNWIEKYNQSQFVSSNQSIPCCLNNRNALKANVQSIDELQSIVAKCEQRGVRLYVTLNSKYCPEVAFSDIADFAREMERISAFHLIVSDLGVIDYLTAHHPKIKVSVSCLAQASNNAAVSFYKKFSSVERIVFPRHMSVNEICSILENNPDMEFEFFGLSNKCMYDDGYCRGLHDLYPICKDIWDCSFYGVSESINLDTQKKLCSKYEAYSRWGKGYGNEGSPEYPWKGVACSICSIKNLIRYDNITLKLAGRGYTIEERVKQVLLCQKIIKNAKNGYCLEDLQHTVKGFFGAPFFCDGINCIMKGQGWK